MKLNKYGLNYINSYKYDILIVLCIVIMFYCFLVIYFNFQNYSLGTHYIFDNSNSVFTTIIIGLISLIGIIFNLKDNDKLRRDQEMKNNLELKQKHVNYRMLFKQEVFSNLSILKDYNDSIYFGGFDVLNKPPCLDIAWKSLYSELPSIFNENELKILMKFYQGIENLLDDNIWMEPVSSNADSTLRSTENLFRVINNKHMIRNIIREILNLEDKLSFLDG